MNKEKRSRSTTTDGNPPAFGFEEEPAPQPIGPAGQHGAYWILSEEERKKGFIRPVRRTYRHVGPLGPKYPLRDLTGEEQTHYQYFGYVKFEAYPEGESSLIGRFWSQEQLDHVGDGCGTITTMSLPIAETWARDVLYYGRTFCVSCGEHLLVNEFRWVDGDERLGS